MSSGLGSFRVVEIAGGLAASWAGRLLADAGAEVLRIESEGGSDPGLRDAGGAGRYFYEYLNAGKLLVTTGAAGAGSPAWQDALASADVILWGGTGPSPALPFTCEEDIRRFNARAVLTSITWYGRTGPWSGFPGDDFVVQHSSGLSFANGSKVTDRELFPPIVQPIEASQYIAGMIAAAVSGASLLRAMKAGPRPAFHDVSCLEAAAGHLRGDVAHVAYRAHTPVRDPKTSAVALIQLCPTSDGWLDLQLVTDEEWDSLMGLFGHPEWAKSEVFATHAERLLVADAIRHLLAEETRSWEKSPLSVAAQALGVTASPVLTPRELLEYEQYRARDAWATLEPPDGRPVLVPRIAGGRGGARITGVRELPSRALPTPERLSAGDRAHSLRSRLGSGSAAADAASDNGDAAAKEAGDGDGPLAGVRVFDCTWYYAGSYATRILAELGADVVKVEPLRPTTDLRSDIPFAEDVRGPNRSGMFNTMNAGKRSVTVDLTRPDHRELAFQLIAKSDLVIENYSAGVLDSFGLTFEAIQAANPLASVISLSGFGATGPNRHFRAWFSTVQSAAGLTAINGYEDRFPKSPGGTFADFASGAYMAWSGVRALLWQQTEGAGSRTELAMTEVVSAFMAEALLQWQVAGIAWQPRGNAPREGQEARMGCPRGVYRCQGTDAWVAMSVDSEAQWTALVRTIGTPALRGLPDLDSRGRVEHEVAIAEELAGWAGARSAWAAAQTLLAAGVPASPCCSAAELLGHPQLLSRGFVRLEPHPEVGPRLGLATPVRMPRSEPARPAPLYGQHNHEVLAALTDAPESVARELCDAAERVRPAKPEG